MSQSTLLKFFTDTHVAKAVAVQLRARGVDVVRCEDVRMADADDAELLTYAAQHQRIMESHDLDFVDLHAAWVGTGKPHSGIFRCSKRLQGKQKVGVIIETIMEYVELVNTGVGTPEDLHNQLIVVE